jgi:flagella basal body P-ring formation protein FlgA
MTTLSNVCRTQARKAAIRALAAALLVVSMGPANGAAAGGRARSSDSLAMVEAAITRAVAGLLGRVETVTVESLEVFADDGSTVVAIPESGAHLGEPSRFALWSEGRRIGTARATVRVRAVHVRALRLVPRGALVTAEDVAVVSGDLGPVPIRLLPVLEEVVGRRARRQIAPGEAITVASLAVPPVVRSGDALDAVLRVGAVEVRARAIASGSGGIGDLIDVLTLGTRRSLRGRIVAPGEVEVIE